jgi:hypothetical protein
MPNISNDQRIKVLTDVAAVTTSSAYTLVARDIATPGTVQMQVTVRGTCVFTCALEGSYDASTWESIGSVTAAGVVNSIDCPFSYVRANVSAFTAAAPGNNISVSLRTFGEYSSMEQPSTVRVRTSNGAYMEYGTNSELLTLSTVAQTTDTTANLLPANSFIDAVAYRVILAVDGTSISVGDATQAARFVSSSNQIGATQGVVGMLQLDPTVASANLGPVQTSAAKVRISCGSQNTGGQVRITVFYKKFIGPTS